MVRILSTSARFVNIGQFVSRNIATNRTVIIQVTTEISLIFPVQILTSTHEISPMPIPNDIENPNAITVTVRNAGNALAGLAQSISLTDDIISTPTHTRAAAVAQSGIIFAMGLKKVASKKQTAEISAVNPVRPPAATPEEAST